MKRAFFVTIFATMLLLTASGVALAQGAGSSDTVEPFALKLFAWLMTEPPDWVTGVLFAVTGFFGALATAYTLIGGVMPATSGQARIDESTARLKRFSERLDKLITPDTASSDGQTDGLRMSLPSPEAPAA